MPNMGIYWGTFDPPTLAHAAVIEQSILQLDLSKLVIVVNDNQATKKKYKSPGRDRVLMVHSMIPESIKNKIVVIRQTDFFPFSYDCFKKRYPDDQWIAVVGQDSFESCAKYIRNCDQVGVVPRGDTSAQLAQNISEWGLTNTHIIDLDKKFLNCSSTSARATYATNRENPMIAPSVNEYILAHGFFKNGYEATHYSAAEKIQHAWRLHRPSR